MGERMRQSIAVVAATAAVWLIVQNTPVLAQAPTLPTNPQIQVEYVMPKIGAFTPIYASLRVRKPLEELQQFLVPLKLPRPIKIQIDTCGAENRTRVPGGPATVCYELIDKIEKTAAGITDPALKQTVIVGTFTQAVLHELAYAVFDSMQIPIWGRLDDAADRLAAFVLLQFSEHVAQTTLIGSAEFFLLSRKTWTGSAFADTASPEAQRFYNYLCIAYGGDNLDFGGWTQAPKGQDPLLPAFRSQQCGYEYEQVRHAFDIRIMPYIDPDLLLRVKAAQWFLAGELPK